MALQLTASHGGSNARRRLGLHARHVHVLSMNAGGSWPRRSLMTFDGTPALRALVALVCRVGSPDMPQTCTASRPLECLAEACGGWDRHSPWQRRGRCIDRPCPEGVDLLQIKIDDRAWWVFGVDSNPA